MKKIIKSLFIAGGIGDMVLAIGTMVSASTADLQEVTVKIIEANKEDIEIILVNNGKEYFYYLGGFALKKLKGQKWKYKRIIDGINFLKTDFLEENSTKIIKIKWKDVNNSYVFDVQKKIMKWNKQ